MLRREGFDVGNVETKEMTDETNPDYATSAKDSEDNDPTAWMLRVYGANQHIDAMRQLFD